MDINANDLDWKNILIKKYTSYGLNELDVMVIFVSDNLLKIQNDLILTYDILSNYMSAKKDDIDSSLTKLFQKKIIVMKDDSTNIQMTLDGFKEKLFNDVLKDAILKDKQVVADDSNDTSSLINDLEQLNGRTFSPTERDRISTWIRQGADEGMIREACHQSISKSGIISFKQADKLILTMITSKERKTLGTSTFDHSDEKSRDEEIKSILLSNNWANNGK